MFELNSISSKYQHMSTIAIDFGTSRTKVAYLDAEGKPDCMRFFNDAPFIPSLFYLPRNSGHIVWGHEAEDRLNDDPAGIIDVPKRKLRESRLRANRRSVTPLELLTLLFRDLREQAGREIPVFGNIPPNALTLTLPALFGPPEERLLLEAAAQAGFDPNRVELIPEPIAAARAWLSATGDAAREVVVLDCGGGTIDWAYLRRDNGGFHIVSECPPGGDRHLGGHDVDLDLFNRLLDRLNSDDQVEAEDQRIRILEQIRKCKERYCLGRSIDPIKLGGRKIHLPETDIQAALDDRFSRQVCDNLNSYLQKVKALTSQMPSPVLLVGGSGKSKGLKESIEKTCGCETRWWNRSEYATVLGAVQCEVLPQPDEQSGTSKRKAVRWYELAPEWIDSLASRCLNNAVLSKSGRYNEWKRVSDIDGSELLRSGLAAEADYEYGELVVKTELFPLVAAARYDILNKIFNGNPSVCLPDFLAGYLDHKNQGRAFEEIKTAMHRLSWDEKLLAVLFVLSLGVQKEWARQTLDTVTENGDIEILGHCARAWKQYFGDVKMATQCMYRMEEQLADWKNILEANHIRWKIMSLAEDWHYLGEHDIAQQLNKKMEHENKDSTHVWCWFAEIAVSWFNDYKEASACLAQAIKCVESKSDWIPISKSFKYLFDDENEALHCLQKDNYFSGVYSWRLLDIAETWLQLFNDRSKTTIYLKEYDKKTNSLLDRINSARYWKRLYNGDAAILQERLAQAETAARRCLHWCICAQGWKELFNDDHRAFRCLERAELQAKHCLDWTFCASYWKKTLNDSEKALRFCRKAEEAASNSSDWLYCAEAWKNVDGNAEQVRRCLNQAEHEYPDWEKCAESWAELLHDGKEAQRCLRNAVKE
jgi:hypothetical protein